MFACNLAHRYMHFPSTQVSPLLNANHFIERINPHRVPFANVNSNFKLDTHIQCVYSNAFHLIVLFDSVRWLAAVLASPVLQPSNGHSILLTLRPLEKEDYSIHCLFVFGVLFTKRKWNKIKSNFRITHIELDHLHGSNECMKQRMQYYLEQECRVLCFSCLLLFKYLSVFLR